MSVEGGHKPIGMDGRPIHVAYEAATPVDRAGDRGEAPRIPVTYRVAAQTKIWIDLLAAAEHVDKTEIVERAIEAYFAERRADVELYLDGLRRAVRGGDARRIAELLPEEHTDVE